MPDPSSSAKLTWQTDAGPAEYLLRPEVVAVAGRQPGNAIVVDDLMLSRRHAQFAWDGEGFTVEDLGSANGTFVNGQRIKARHRLVDGDEVRLDQRRFKFQLVQSGAALAAAASETIVAPSVARTAGTRLLVRAGPDAGQEIAIEADSLTIGRAGRNATWEVRLTDRSVSRPHVRIERHGDEYSVVDLGSANGTQVNDQAITGPRRLADGDVITIGETRLVFRMGAPPS